MKKISFIALLLSLGMFLVGCSYLSASDAQVEMPSEALLEQVKEDYYLFLYQSLDGYDSEKSVKVNCCYGVYNDCVAVIISELDEQFPQWEVYEEVAGVTFRYGVGNKIKIWRNGSFYSLQEAYDQEFITEKDLRVIAEVHNN